MSVGEVDGTEGAATIEKVMGGGRMDGSSAEELRVEGWYVVCDVVLVKCGFVASVLWRAK